VKFIVGEANSVNCGGTQGVSDVFGSALWALDTLLEVAKLNASQWNMHGGPHNVYSPVQSKPPFQSLQIMPVFYGMWAVSVATANHSTLLQANVQSSSPLIKIHCLRETKGQRATRVVVIHKDLQLTDEALVTVNWSGNSATATLERLVAPSIKSSYGISFGGLTFDGTGDGMPVGTRVREEVPLLQGTFSFKLTKGSAAILTIQSV
jgi:hypothetical protein